MGEGYSRNRLGGYLNSCEIARGELGELIGYIHHLPPSFFPHNNAPV